MRGFSINEILKKQQNNPSVKKWMGYSLFEINDIHIQKQLDQLDYSNLNLDSFINSIQLKTKEDQIDEVNFYVNKLVKYERDIGDHWQSPHETISKERGDCEDFAILKKAILEKLGYKDIVILLGYDFKKNMDHAVLGVNLTRWNFLDNKYDVIQTEESLLWYLQPLMIINDSGMYQLGNKDD